MQVKPVLAVSVNRLNTPAFIVPPSQGELQLGH